MGLCRWYLVVVFFCCGYGNARTSLWERAESVVESKEHFHELCMDVWTRIDLVQAISTSRHQREMVLRRLVKNLACLSASLEKITVVEESCFYRKLFKSMKFSFVNAFPASKNRWYKKGLVLLRGMTKKLKRPIYLKAECSS